MNVCPITYEACGNKRYSPVGLKKLSPRLTDLAPLPFTADELVREAAARASKMSIQGVQPKLSAVLDVKHGAFQIVDRGGRYILKPQNPLYPFVPENEGLCMRMAAAFGIDVPLSGLVASGEDSWTYFIRRFDRVGRTGKVHVEDFAQLAGRTRDTKYDASMEQVAALVERYCTFPKVELARLFRRTLFNYLIGNEDMHLKNFSIIVKEGKVALSPAYDQLSTTVAMEGAAAEEFALPLAGKKRKISRKILVDYFAIERMGLPQRVVDGIFSDLARAMGEWRRLIPVSFLPEAQKHSLENLLAQRAKRLRANGE